MTPANAMLIASATHATVPWRSSEARLLVDARIKVLPDLDNDTQRQIDMCLRCPYEDCIGCIDGWKELRFITYTAKPRKRKKKR